MTTESITKEKENTIERKEFMKQVGISFGAILLMNCLQACTGADIPDPNPGGGGGKVDFTLNLDDAANASLRSAGGFLVTKDVIVARPSNDFAFIAVSAICTHQGTKLEYRGSTNDFKCFPKNGGHDSEFTATGAVQKGPATAPLKRFNSAGDKTANTVRIFE